MVELLKLGQNDFVTVSIDGEDFHRAPDDNVGAVACFAFSKDERRGGELYDLGDLRERAELVRLEIAEQSEAVEELLTFLRNHGLFSRDVDGSLQRARRCHLMRQR